MNRLLLCLSICLTIANIGFAQTASDSPAFTPKPGSDIKGFSFKPYTTVDRYGRTIQFYLSKSKANKDPDKELPLVVCIQGSGSQSLFWEMEISGKKRIVSGGPEAVVSRDFGDQVRVLVVEKPGVKFLEQPSRPGSATEGSAEFNREFSLERWTDAIDAAVRSTVQLHGILAQPILALGHSEGGQVACHLAASNPKITHVANMAGSGPTQLYDLLQQARAGDMYDPNATPEERVNALLSDWNKVLKDPNASDKFILGHSHLRWSSFLSTSPIEAILKSNANVFLATGTADKNSFPGSSDAFYAALLARGRTCEYLRIEGANHGFMLPDDKKGAGWKETNGAAIRWFLQSIDQ